MSENGSGKGGGSSVPKAFAIGGAALVGFTMLAVLFGRSESVGLTALPPGIPVARLDFNAEDQVDGSIAIRDASNARLVTMIQPAQDGFVRGTLRALAQSRQRAGLGREAPFSLVHFEDGRLALSDTATGREVALEAFGPTNAQAFARLLASAERTP